MSIASAIQNAQQKVANAYTAVDNKGGTLPATQDLSNLPTAISSIPDATEPTLASLTITPSTTAQTLTPPSGTDGYNTVQVSAVTASIDSDIVAGNIKSGVNILGVSGTVVQSNTTTLNVTPSTTSQTITPTSPYNGFSSVSVGAVTSSIDSDIQAGNIKSGVNILGVTGTVTALAGETRTVSITSTSGNTFTPSSGKNGITSIKCNPTNKALTITPTTTTQTFTVPTNYSGYGTVTCDASSGGVTPTGTYTITANGTYDVTNYANANVNVPGGASIGITREISANGVYQMPTSSTTFSLPSNATGIGDFAMYYAFARFSTSLTSVDLSSLITMKGDYAMAYAFYLCSGLTSVDLSNLTTIMDSRTNTVGYTSGNNMSHAFADCRNLTNVDLSSLTTVSGESAMECCFEYCTSLTSVDLSSLTTVDNGMRLKNCMFGIFRYCTSLTSVDFSNLQTIGNPDGSSHNDYSHFSHSFFDCNNLTTLTFPKLEKIYCTGGNTQSYGTFYNNNCIRKMYFPKLDTITYGSGASSGRQTACKYIFSGCTLLTELHFAAANQAAIEASPGYSTAWGRGAGNVTIYFDL